ncbi:MAG TPA: hypothetical protein VIJ50_03820, partial [Solirubrobacteraceae bacterium]
VLRTHGAEHRGKATCGAAAGRAGASWEVSGFSGWDAPRAEGHNERASRNGDARQAGKHESQGAASEAERACSACACKAA